MVKNQSKLKVMRREQPGQLYVTKLKRGQRQGIDYKYLVRTSGATSHTAFRTKAGLDQWLKERNLKVPEKWKSGTQRQKVKGSYQRVSWKGTQEQLDARARKERWKPTKVLSNGRYVRGYIQKTTRGNRIHYMNPNYEPRELKYVRK